MKNRKGASDFVAYLIVSVIILVVVGSLYFIFSEAEMGGVKSMPCTFSNKIKSVIPSKMANLFVSTFGPVRFCKIQQKIIDPQDWGACDKQYEQNSAVNLAGAARNCTMQQVLDVALNCWEMGGSGKIHPGSYKCYVGMVKLSADSSGASIKSQRELRDTYKGDMLRELGCMPGQKADCVLNELNPGCRCEDVANELAEKQTNLVIANSLILYYKDMIANNVTESGYGSEGYLVYCGSAGVDVSLLTSHLLELTTPKREDVERLLGNKMNIGKKGCDDVVGKVYSFLTEMRAQAVKVQALQEDIRMKLDSCVIEGRVVDEKDIETTGNFLPAGGEVSKIARIYDLMNTTIKLTTSVPAVGLISENDLQEFSKIAKTERGQSYYFELGGAEKTLTLMGDYKIGPNSMFEVAFCDGVELVSGIGAWSACGVQEATKIQIGTIGSGAGGVSRGENPVCSLTDVLKLGPFGGGDAIDTFCSGRYWKTENILQ